MSAVGVSEAEASVKVEAFVVEVSAMAAASAEEVLRSLEHLEDSVPGWCSHSRMASLRLQLLVSPGLPC
jgi:hypothetical protein